MGDSSRQVGGRSVDVSNLEKVLFPDVGITKAEVLDYYEGVADVMLPHLQGRLISMHRWPDGLDGHDFYQKEAPDYFPDWICTRRVEKKEGGTNRQVVVEEAATLVYLAQQACLTPHMWLSRAVAARCPDRMVFDFDPPGAWEEAWVEVRWAARRLREVLDEAGLASRVMLSGSRGLHVHVPLDDGVGFGEAKEFSRDVARLLASRHPARLTTEQRKDRRRGRIFLDYLRNEYAQTTAAPYAVRARTGAPVATPLAWGELSRSGMDPRRYHLRNLFRRLGQRDDPWEGLDDDARGLSEARQILDDLQRDHEREA